MTDIVDELRAAPLLVCANDLQIINVTAAAADEIEKLRAYNARLVVDACKAADEIERKGMAYRALEARIGDLQASEWEIGYRAGRSMRDVTR